jgi:O-antigen ligase
LQQSPWWGVPNYLAQMQNLRQGEGIIDLVNTYLVVALNSGVAGLVLVFTPYVVTLWRAARTSAPEALDAREARTWIALTVAVMVAIFVLSPISIVQPIMVWVIALPLARMQQPGIYATKLSHEKRIVAGETTAPAYADAWR